MPTQNDRSNTEPGVQHISIFGDLAAMDDSDPYAEIRIMEEGDDPGSLIDRLGPDGAELFLADRAPTPHYRVYITCLGVVAVCN